MGQRTQECEWGGYTIAGYCNKKNGISLLYTKRRRGKKAPSISFAWLSYKRAVEMIEKNVKTVMSGGNSMLGIDFCLA